MANVRPWPPVPGDEFADRSLTTVKELCRSPFIMPVGSTGCCKGPAAMEVFEGARRARAVVVIPTSRGQWDQEHSISVLTEMRTIALPFGKAIPVLGQGTWHMAEHSRRRADEIAALRVGIDLGMTVIDTAEMYADGDASIARCG